VRTITLKSKPNSNRSGAIETILRRVIIGKELHSRRSSLGFALLAILFIAVGCEAPHDNPFDPSSSAYLPPVPPLPVTDLLLVQDSLNALSALIQWTTPEGADEYYLYHGPVGWDGKLQTGYIPYDGELPGVKPAGSRQQLWITLTPGLTRVWALYSRSEAGLMSDPSNLLTIQAPNRDRPSYIAGVARSSYKRSWGFFDLVDLDLTATVSDTDGVDSVWATSDIGLLGALDLTPYASRWAATISEDSLPGKRLEMLVGHPIWIYCLDGLGNVTRSEANTLVRVLYIPPLPDYPSYQDTVNIRPTLTWYSYSVDFTHTFTIDVSFLRAPQNVITLVYHKDEISPDSLSHTLSSDLEPTLEDSLDSGNSYYFWTLTVVDEFGDRITSLENTFEVKSGD